MNDDYSTKCTSYLGDQGPKWSSIETWKCQCQLFAIYRSNVTKIKIKAQYHEQLCISWMGIGCSPHSTEAKNTCMTVAVIQTLPNSWKDTRGIRQRDTELCLFSRKPLSMHYTIYRIEYINPL